MQNILKGKYGVLSHSSIIGRQKTVNVYSCFLKLVIIRVARSSIKCLLCQALNSVFSPINISFGCFLGLWRWPSFSSQPGLAGYSGRWCDKTTFCSSTHTRVWKCIHAYLYKRPPNMSRYLSGSSQPFWITCPAYVWDWNAFPRKKMSFSTQKYR